MFVVCTLLASALYWTIAANNGKKQLAPEGGEMHGLMFFTPETPLESKTGNDARIHFLLIAGGGGFVGMVIYLIASFRDPYGTTKVGKTGAAARRDRFEFLKSRDLENDKDKRD